MLTSLKIIFSVILYLVVFGTRPLGIPDDNGSILVFNNGDASFDICGSLSLPINVIDSGKVCHSFLVNYFQVFVILMKMNVFPNMSH